MNATAEAKHQSDLHAEAVALARVTARLSMPFAVRLNPALRGIQEESLSWASSHGIANGPRLAWIRESQIARLAALTNPFADCEALRLINDWYVWLYAFDDGMCDESGRGGSPAQLSSTAIELNLTLDGGAEAPAPGGPFSSALADLARRISAAEPRTRWPQAVRDYLAGQVWESAYKAAGMVPDPPSYTRLREASSACSSVFTLLGIAGGAPLDPRVLDDPAIAQLARHANHIIGWDNDLYSYPKETGDHHALANIVTVLRHYHRTTTGHAFELVLALREAELKRYRAAKRRLGTRRKRAAEHFIRGMEHWISGSLEFHRTSPRFRTGARAARGDDLGG